MINNYPEISDDELLQLFRSGDERAGGELAERYRPLVKRCTRPYFLMGGDSEDLIQEGMIGLVCSMQGYDIDGPASFKSYAEICIKRRILDAIRAASRFKHMPLNYRLSLEDIYKNPSADISSICPDKYTQSPEELIIEQENKNDLWELCRILLSPLEKKVLSFYLDGLSYEEISVKCGKPVKSVDSALQRIKKKLARACSQTEA
ncbi:MAG: sigma-70 family RNA polymerase sigma factor [Candidatus Limivicinus sp.]|jgi:RNA polymerase sporulation-specific sigma factor